MKITALIILIATYLLVSCTPEPQPINYGKDECVLCKMIIAQKPWGAEIVTHKSKILKFDAIECMAKYINDGYIKTDDVHSSWVVDFAEPGKLINAEDAYFLRSRSLPSPMAMFLTAFSSEVKLEETMKEHNGDLMNWAEVKRIVKAEWGD